MHFGNIDTCKPGDAQAAVASLDTPYLKKEDAVYPIDSKALVPYCYGPTAKGDMVVVYKKGTNYMFWGCVGLLGLLFLILLISAVK
jgi:hypothetical protein